MIAYFDGNDMVLEGYPMVINQPSNIPVHTEIMTQEALDTADLSNVFLTVNHDPTLRLARTGTKSLVLTKDAKGIKMVAKLSQNKDSREVFEAIRAGKYKHMSFRAEFLEDKTVVESWGIPVVYITRLGRVYDVSIVDKPAYEQTELKIRSGGK